MSCFTCISASHQQGLRAQQRGESGGCMVGWALLAGNRTMAFCMSEGRFHGEPLVVTSIALLHRGILQWLRLWVVAFRLIFDCCWWMLLCENCNPCVCTSAVRCIFMQLAVHTGSRVQTSAGRCHHLCLWMQFWLVLDSESRRHWHTPPMC